MVGYAVMMFVMASAFLYLGIQIFRGKTDLIHGYHQKKVKDKAAYGKDFAKAMFVMVLGFFSSGIVGLLGETQAMKAVVLMVAGILAGLGCIFAVQKKHNKGIF